MIDHWSFENKNFFKKSAKQNAPKKLEIEKIKFKKNLSEPSRSEIVTSRALLRDNDG